MARELPEDPAPEYDDATERAIVDHRYAPVVLSDTQRVRVQSLREGARLLSRHVIRLCPNSWERDEALKAIDVALGFSQRAIERHEGDS